MCVYRWPAGTALAALLLAGVGCADRPQLVKVSGVVLLDSKPVKDVTVTFVPEGSGPPAAGVTDEDGTFVLTTSTVGDGARPGDYKVVMTVPVVFERDIANTLEEYLRRQEEGKQKLLRGQTRPPAERWKKKDPHAPKEIYSDVATTPLRCRVPAEGTVTFALESEKSK
jgi:hypothetical protein